MSYPKRFIKTTFGLILFSVGVYLSIQANIGLSPWDAFSIGFSNILPFSYGDIVVISGILILFLDYLLKEKIGFGTLLNIVLIGKCVDFFNYLDIVPKLDNFYLGVVMLLIAQVILSIATYFYIDGALGCGPRDALMNAMQRKFPKMPIGISRGLIEGTALLIGWILGAKVGIGTLISIFGISIVMQYTFKILDFDIKTIKHENIFDTIRIIIGKDVELVKEA